MLKEVRDLPAGVIGIQASGTVTAEDYEKTLIPMLESSHRKGERVAFLYETDPSFERYTAGAAYKDFRVGIHYLRMFRKCAIVTEADWLRKSTEAFTALMPCPVRVYSPADRDKAIAWLDETLRFNGIPHTMYPDKRTLLVEPNQKLSQADFEDLAAVVDPWIEEHGSLHGLVVHTKDFPGWKDFGAMVRHMQFVKDHHKKVRRLAIAADGEVADLLPKLAGHFVDADIKKFKFDDLDGAMAWASEGFKGDNQTGARA